MTEDQIPEQAIGKSLYIRPYTVLIMRQKPIRDKRLKTALYPCDYSREEIDFKQLTVDELNNLYLEAQEIEARIQTMLAQRG